MRRIYICHTMYQILISLLKMDVERDSLMSVDIIGHFPDVREQLQHVHLIEETERSFDLYSLIARSKTKERLSLLQSYDEVIIFQDHRQVGHFLNKHRIPYSLLEDGYNFFKDKRVCDLESIQSSVWKRLFYQWYFKPTYLIGSSPYCQSIEVNDLSLVQFDEAYKPFVEVPRKQLFDQASPEKVQALLQIFGARAIVADEESSQKRLLLLTQPLSWDYHVTEEELLEIYVAGLAPYREDYTIYIKPHPRDGVDYSFLGKAVVLLPQGIPFELFEMAGSIRFDIGMTYSSSALDFLNCFEEKVYLKDTFPLLSKNDILREGIE
ncbi:TPA: lipooligosaccharide sialyltransferase [Streptococcus suis]|uniref:glycosyltransferase family 52 n=1 Tax=Streptococcus suis TaxID=1307 RepID=UPI0005CF1B78|nr:glycosyltransferase family 52 [Streptococcus suis]NQF49496.1 lipooligosaccharide sialyltransferase [Streptococcus suis]NQS08378.1 lipooligosaccharide sialyltransferase [Streptococcus suis]NQS56044.1 lipooligosaccharide sialyltransferase [Streptococcus suis]CYX01002.1 lipooligosaccharide sialyltransferase [Streptococcus suis]CYX02074.1 lipooligosaccharide sialyltransferase [Streptococcus suis]